MDIKSIFMDKKVLIITIDLDYKHDAIINKRYHPTETNSFFISTGFNKWIPFLLQRFYCMKMYLLTFDLLILERSHLLFFPWFANLFPFINISFQSCPIRCDFSFLIYIFFSTLSNTFFSIFRQQSINISLALSL